MTRAWRRTCPLSVRRTQERATGEATGLFLLRQAGPAAYVIAESASSNRVTVYLGDVHACTCRDFALTKDLCLHIVWVLLKKLKLKSSDPLSFQKGLAASELSRALAGPQPQQKCRHRSRSPGSRVAVPRRNATLADSCPICLDPFAARPLPICHCKYGCGQAVHVRCLVVLGKHQARAAVSLPPAVVCPLCRGDFCLWSELGRLETRLARHKSQPVPLPVHPVACTACADVPVRGALYRCLPCPQVIVCSSCLANGSLETLHSGHGIAVKITPEDKWRQVKMPDEGPARSREPPGFRHSLSLPEGNAVPSASKMALESGSLYKVPTLEQMIEATILLQENLLFGPSARHKSLTNIRKILKRRTEVKLPPPEVRVHRVELYSRKELPTDSPKKQPSICRRVRRSCQQVEEEPKQNEIVATPEQDLDSDDDDTRWSSTERGPLLAVRVYPRASSEDSQEEEASAGAFTEPTPEEPASVGRAALEMATARVDGPKSEARGHSGLEARNWSLLRARRWAAGRSCTSAC